MATYEIFIVADAAQAEAVMERLAAKTAVVGEAAAAESPKVQTLAQILTGLGPAGILANTAISDVATSFTGKLGVGAQTAQASIAGVEEKVAGMGSTAATAAVGVGVAGAALLATVEITKKATEAYVDFAEQVKTLETLTGQSAESSSVLVTFFKDLGIQADTAGRAFGFLAQAIQAGKLDKYGIDVAKAADGTTDLVGTLENVAQKFQDTADASQRDAMAKALLSRGYSELVPLLGRTKEELRAIYSEAQGATPVLNQDDVNRAEALQVAMRNLSAELDKLWVELGTQVVPAVENFVNAFDALGKKLSEAPDWLQKFANVAENFFLPVWVEVGKAIGDFGADQTMAQEKAQALTDTLASQAHAVHELNTEYKAAHDTAVQYAQDQISAEQSDLRIKELQQQWAQQVADAEAKKAADIKAAQQSVADADQRVKDLRVQNATAIINAQDAVRAAQERLRQDSLVNVQTARTVADAQLALARAKEDAASSGGGVDATRRVQDAETALARARDDQATAYGQQQQQIGDDQTTLARAQQNLANVQSKAALDMAKAQEAERKAVQDLKKAQDEAGISALDRAKHELDLRSALLQQQLAHEKLSTDIATMRGEVEKTNGAWKVMHDELQRLHVSDIPAVENDLKNLQKAATDAAKAGVTAVPSVGPGWIPPGVGGPNGLTVNVNNPIILNGQGADVVGKATAMSVYKELNRLRLISPR